MKKLDQIVSALHDMGFPNNVDRADAKVLDIEKSGSRVYHVFTQDINLGGDIATMTHYLTVTKEDSLASVMRDIVKGYAFALVDNTSWGIEEFGSVGVKLTTKGVVRTW